VDGQINYEEFVEDMKDNDQDQTAGKYHNERLGYGG
jgi:hypothetical protein